MRGTSLRRRQRPCRRIEAWEALAPSTRSNGHLNREFPFRVWSDRILSRWTFWNSVADKQPAGTRIKCGEPPVRKPTARLTLGEYLRMISCWWMFFVLPFWPASIWYTRSRVADWRALRLYPSEFATSFWCRNPGPHFRLTFGLPKTNFYIPNRYCITVLPFKSTSITID